MYPSTRFTTACIAAIATASLMTTTASATAAPTSTSTLGTERARAAALTIEVDRLDMEASDLQEQLRSALAQQVDIDRQLGRARTSQQAAEQDVAQGRDTLESRAVAIYQDDANAQSGWMLLSYSNSLQQLFDRVEVTHRVQVSDQQIVVHLDRLKREATHRRIALQELELKQRRAVATTSATKAGAERKLDARRAVLAGVNQRIQRLIRARRAAAAAAAAARSRAIARSMEEDRSMTSGVMSGSFQNSTHPSADAAPSAAGASPSTAQPVPNDPSASEQGAAAVAVALRYIGTPYLWGGSQPGGFDCSGLVQYAYAQVGVSLPRTTYGQWDVGRRINRDELEVGDLLFFHDLGHMGIYIGGGQMIHAPHTGDVVKISSLSESWYVDTYQGAVRP